MIGKYQIPCGHEREGTPHNVKLHDYHPLDRGSVKALLMEAHRLNLSIKVKQAEITELVKNFSDIHCRMAQAIKGSVCPHDISGPNAYYTAQLDSLYVNTAEDAITDALVDQFCLLMEADATDESFIRANAKSLNLRTKPEKSAKTKGTKCPT